MPAYNFKLRFADLIRKGKKRQTIRKDRKDGRVPKAGDAAFCFTGMRTRQCDRLGDYEIKEVYEIKIAEDFLTIFPINHAIKKGSIPHDTDKFARADGFKNWNELINFFRFEHGLPFVGTLIKWKWTRSGGLDVCDY